MRPFPSRRRRGAGSVLASARGRRNRDASPVLDLQMTFCSNPWQRFRAALSLAALLLLDTSPAGACTCGGPLEPTVAITRADVVFEGTARDQLAAEADTGVPGYRGATRFDFEVVRYFKGQ